MGLMLANQVAIKLIYTTKLTPWHHFVSEVDQAVGRGKHGRRNVFAHADPFTALFSDDRGQSAGSNAQTRASAATLAWGVDMNHDLICHHIKTGASTALLIFNRI
jgi:hypothetical protein